jgi:hypothetical protein
MNMLKKVTKMTIYLNDEREYSEIIDGWVREFICTMDDGLLRPGDDSGRAPFGVKIIFDGYADLETYGENNEYVYEEGGDTTIMSFAVFVHKNSLTEEFLEHEQTPWALIHRPKEEVCIYVWYNQNDDSIDVIPFEDNDSTELDHQFVTDLIFKIEERDTSE